MSLVSHRAPVGSEGLAWVFGRLGRLRLVFSAVTMLKVLVTAVVMLLATIDAGSCWLRTVHTVGCLSHQAWDAREVSRGALALRTRPVQ